MSLVVAHVGHRYASSPPVLVDVSFVVHPGTLVALTGPSGSGKTTLLSIVGGLLRPSTGVVTLDGEAVEPSARLRRTSIAWVFQGSNALLRRSVVDNVALRGLAVGMSTGTARDEAAVALEAVGLGHRLHRQAGTLSGGELQRMGIARALVGAPRLICADEPSSNLDQRSTEAVIDALVRASTTAPTLVATHDPLVAARATVGYRLVNGALAGEVRS